MLSLEYRPQTFSQMAGQDSVKKALMHIVKDPTNSPKTLLLCGHFGTGKTTAARIFARALNCENQTPQGDACGKCNSCLSDIQTSMFYSEYDSAVIGNVNSIRELRDTFYFGYNKGYKVIVLDEVHLVSRAAQGALLKVLEEPEPNVFYLLCTTDPDKLLPTITSRSYELRYSTLTKEEIIPYLKYVLGQQNIEVTEEVEKNLSLIADRSNGHMRNAMMLLDSMLLLKEDFRETVRSSGDLFLNLIMLGLSYKSLLSKVSPEELNNRALKIISTMNRFSLKHLKQDFESIILDVAKGTLFETDNESIIKMVVNFKGSYDLVLTLNDPVIHASFNNSTTFQIGMIVLFNRLKDLSMKLSR